MNTYVYIRSWHIVLTPTRVPNRYRTLCGKDANGPTLEAFPVDEKTCESCLRLAALR